VDAAARSDQKGKIPLTRADLTSNPDAAEVSLRVELDRTCDDALLRIVSLLHRRRCRVTAAEFSAEPGASGRLALRMLAPAAHASRVEHWLASLIDVREVARAEL
jgi:hypothetical protein